MIPTDYSELITTQKIPNYNSGTSSCRVLSPEANPVHQQKEVTITDKAQEKVMEVLASIWDPHSYHNPCTKCVVVITWSNSRGEHNPLHQYNIATSVLTRFPAKRRIR